MSRLFHSAVSFAIVLVAYWIYALVAVPLIEPSIAGPSGTIADGSLSEPGEDLRIKQWEGLFPPGALDPKKTKVLENDKVILLLNDYKNLGDGRVELNPCTMIFPWDGPAEDEAQRKRQAVILEAPQGAILKFNEPLDLGRFRIGRLESGSLRGPITIRSQGKSPGPEDDLLILTSDVQLNGQEVCTPNPLKFTWGKNYGSGQDMHIKLLADPSKAGSDINAPNVAGVEVFEMRRVERLHLESAASASPATSPASPASASNPTDAFMSPAAGADLPVEITCRGAFTFNVVKRVATFVDQVNVVRVNPNGPSDQIQSELLSMYFAPRDKSKADSDNSSELEIERIEARGHPVVINAPTQNLTGRGERLEYNIKSNLISLDGDPEVFLRQGPNEIHGRSLQYQSLGPNRLGTAAAQGPGWLRGQMADKPEERLEAHWNDQLRMFPQDQNHVISFTGGAILDYAGIGHMEAKEIFFWLKETPPGGPPDQPRLQPDRMMARNRVSVNSSQLSAAVEQLEVWFEQKDSPQKIRWKAESNGETVKGQGALGNPPSIRFTQPKADTPPTSWRQDGQPRTAYLPPLTMPVTANSVATVPQPFQSGQQAPLRQPWQLSPSSRLPATPRYPRYLPQPPPSQLTPPPGSQNPAIPAQGGAVQQHFKVNGRILRARIQLQDQQSASLAEIMIEDGVRLEETQTLATDERPILIQGDRLHGTDVSSPTAVVNVTGGPAHFEGRGLGLTGSNINLNRGTNRLWIDGPGRMDLPLSNNTAGQTLIPGQPTAMSGTLLIEWKKNMLFDGSTAKFEESVSATMPQQHVQTEILEVRLKSPLSFSDPNIQNQNQTDVEELRCYGGVFLENRSADAQQQPASYDRMQVADLAVNMQSGAVTAGGPGWLNSVRFGSNNPAQNQFGPGLLVGNPAATAAANNAPAESKSQLICMHIRFQGSITGNLFKQQLTFHDQIRAAYAPAADWTAMIDPATPEKLGPYGVVLNCDHLEVTQMPVPSGNTQNIELKAYGNTVVDGDKFTARASRISFDMAKDMLILEGDGRSDAQLFKQTQIGGPRSSFSARKIIYFPKTNRLDINGARSLEINQGK